MGEVDYVYGSPDSPQDQVAFSAFVNAMHERDMMALTRAVKTKARGPGAPKLGVLCPVPGWGDMNIDLCYWAQARLFFVSVCCCRRD
jgi:hypothetical protein